MRRKLLNQYGFDRKLRQLSVLIALLLLPIGAWAENYNLTVAGVTVNEINAANVLGDDDATISFDAETNTLTLNGYDNEAVYEYSYEGAFIKSSLPHLTINLVGNNRVHCNNQSSFLAKNDAVTGECIATFTTDLHANEPGSIDIYTSSLSNDHTIYYDGLAWTKVNDGDNGDYFSFTSNFRLSVGGAILCDSNGDALEVGSFGNTVTFSADNNTLTLDGATINGNIVVKDAMSALNIKVKGQSVINSGNLPAIKSYTTQSAALSFAKEGTGDCSLQLNSDDVTIISTGFSEPTYIGLALVVEDENIDPEYYSNRGLYHYDSGDYVPITSATITSYTIYGIIISGEAVTSVNMNSILKGTVGVGHISFDGDHTLTLNKVPNYVFNGSYPFIQTSMDLTINLVGNSEFDCGQSIFIKRMDGDNETHTVTFTTDANHAGTLILTVGNQFDGFEAFYQNGLKLNPDDYYNPEDENKPAMWIAQESLGLKVGGIVVTQGNSSDILGTGYGSVSYNSTTNTLTLKGAMIDSPSEDAIVISEDIKALTVRLVGYNHIGSQDHYVFNLQGSTTLTFTTSETMPGSINSYGHILYANQQALATYENGLALNADNNEMKAETGTMNVVYLTGFVNYVNSDNGGTAFIYTNNNSVEATVAELKNNAVVVSTPEGSTQTEMWLSVDASILEKFTFQFDWATCTNKNVKVQVVGYNQNEEESYDWVADGKTYSDEISLSTADGDGIVEIPLTSDVTSGQVRLKFSSTEAFSFVSLNIGITQAVSYPIIIAGTPVTGKNADDVLGDEKVSYDAETNTLMLDGATIGDGSDLEPSVAEACGIEYTGGEDLTISLKGTNTIAGTGGCEAIRCDAFDMETVPKLIFAKGDNQICSLQLSAEESRTVISGFAQIDGVNGINEAYGNSLTLLFDEAVSYDSESDGLYYLNNEEEPVPVTSAMITSGYGLMVGGVMVYEGNASNIFNGDETNDGKVSYNATTNTLTLDNATLKNGIISSLADLKIKFRGTNQINIDGQSSTWSVQEAASQNAISSTVGTATLTFEKDGDSSVELFGNTRAYYSVISGFASVSYGSGDGLCYLHTSSPSYYIATETEQNLINIYDGGNISNATVSGESAYPLWFINSSDQGTQVTSTTVTASAVTAGTVTFNPSNNTLSLNGVTMEGKILSGLGNLTMDITGANYIASSDSGSVVRSANAGTLTIKKIGDKASLQLNVWDDSQNPYPVIKGFTALSYEGLNLVADEGATYGVYDLWGNNVYGLYNPNKTEGYDKRITSALFTTATYYPLVIAGNQVTSENANGITGTGITQGTISFTPAVAAEGDTPATLATLTLNGVDYSPTGTDPLVVSGLDNLTVKLVGSNSVYVSSTAEVYPEAAFVSSNSEASLTFTTDESDRLQPLNTNTVVLASGFNNIVFTGYLYRDQNMVKNLLAPTPNMSEGYLAINRAGYEPDATTFNYEIEYVDGSESATGTYDMSKTASDNNIVLDKPCTVTVYAQYGTVKSAEKVGKLFGFADGNELNVTYGTTQIEMPALVPAIAEADGITISREGNFVDDDKTMINLEGKTAGNAATTIITSLTSSDNTPYILLNTIVNLSINITKATPTITFAQERYSATLGETFTSPATVDYWTVSPTASSNTSVANISEGQIVLVGVGTTTITVTYAGNDNYNSTTASYELVVSRALDVAFVGSNLWASYYATENLSIPENLTAYVVDDVDEMTGEVTVSPISYIPEYNAVLLKRADGASANGYVAAPYTGTTSSVPNLLSGSDEAVDISDINGGSVYVLYNDMFKRATSGTIPARRGYLVLGIEQVSRLNIVFDDTSTAISTLAVEEKGENWYSVDGRKLSGQPQRRGLYIKNGKKVFVTNNK